MSLSRRLFALTGLSAALFLGACASSPAPVSITDTAAATPELSTLAKLVNDAGLADTLRGNGPFTVFAPTNDAFKKVPAATMAQLASDKEMLRSVLTYHVVPGRITAAEVKTGPLKSVQGANLAVSKAGTFVTVEDALVVKADVAATNGVVHLVDTVLIPPAPRR